jgi:hypothetical protein
MKCMLRTQLMKWKSISQTGGKMKAERKETEFVKWHNETLQEVENM